MIIVRLDDVRLHDYFGGTRGGTLIRMRGRARIASLRKINFYDAWNGTKSETGPNESKMFDLLFVVVTSAGLTSLIL